MADGITELEALTYAIAHDLRAPVRQITGFSNMLARECGPELTPEAQRHLQRIQDGAQHMGVMMDGLLSLFKIGQHRLSRRITPLNGLVEATLEFLSPESQGREIQWHIEDLGSVECDAGLIQQVFLNLISNGLKFTRPRDPAVIHIGRNIGLEPAIFIQDNGVGFDMEYAGKLFGMFQRLHSSKDFEGSGVGLTIAQRIIQKHGGRIWAESEPEHGATFCFTIPSEVVAERLA